MAQKRSTKPTDTGMNRTGIAASPLDAKKMIEAAERASASDGGPERIAAFRAEASSAAPPHGTMPPPATVKGAVKAAAKMLKNEKANVLIDKLGERLAFERSGVRLYDAVLAKLPASKTSKGDLDRGELRQLRDAEHRHMLVVTKAIEQLGADPTAMTPCANFAGVQGSGLFQSVTDPRATLTQCLDTLLAAELIDNDSWKMLIALAEGLGHTQMAQEFTECLAEEDEHLMKVRSWLAERLEIQAGAKLPSPDFGEPTQPA
jgi:rubrerythrin